MELDKSVVDDLRFLAQLYGWDAADKREVMASINATSSHYYVTLAAAHRAGYEQTSKNHFQRLHAWCISKGFGDPFAPGFDLAALRTAAEQPTQHTIFLGK